MVKRALQNRGDPYIHLQAKKGTSVPAFEIILRRTNHPDRVRYCNRSDAQIGDVVEVDGRPWVVIEKEPPFKLRRIERIICVPRTVMRLR